ncbi:MAG: basic amino acid ABC transporter substrate-binding protein [Acutalibacteraceae bacterium]
MKKIFALLCAACMLTASLPACSQGSSESSTASNTASDSGSDESSEETASVTTVTEGKLTMATNATFPPYEYYDGNDIVGIDAEIAAKIAEKLGLELEITDMEFNSIITSVNQGKADMGMAGMTVSEDRLKNVDFSDSYAKGVQVVIVKEDGGIKSLDDLAGKKIGVQLNTTGDIYATDEFGKDNVQQFNKATDTVLALTQGKVDAVIIDKAPAEVFVQQNEGLKLLDSSYADEDYAICFKKGNTELQKAVNDALNELIEDGTVQAIIDKYIPAE